MIVLGNSLLWCSLITIKTAQPNEKSMYNFENNMDQKNILPIGKIVKEVKDNKCSRAILVGHNSSFDLSFLNACVERNNIKRNPFHPFSSFDTATLAGLIYGQTVLSKAALAAGLEWDDEEAHSARYDAEQTAHLFCKIVNKWNKHSDIF